MWMLSGNDQCSERILGARLGYLHRNLVAQARNLGAPGYWAPVRQQPCLNIFVSHVAELENIVLSGKSVNNAHAIKFSFFRNV